MKYKNKNKTLKPLNSFTVMYLLDIQLFLYTSIRDFLGMNYSFQLDAMSCIIPLNHI